MILRLSKDQPNLALGEDSLADVRTAAKKKLADAGLRIVTHYSRYPLTKDAAQSRKVFEYAKEMGTETLVAEPSEDAFDTIEKLCEEYGINVAIHDHAKPSHYWNPDTVLKVCRGRSKRIGACADTGHWTRSGLKPAECVRKLEGRIISFHVKDKPLIYPKGIQDDVIDETECCAGHGCSWPGLAIPRQRRWPRACLPGPSCPFAAGKRHGTGMAEDAAPA
jgi:sugar phosphate isomerase/epimerase